MYADPDLVSFSLFSLRPLTFWYFCQPFLLTDPHRFNPKDGLREDETLLFLETLLHLQLQVPMGCRGLDRIVILPAVKTREQLYFVCTFLTYHSPPRINLLSSQPPTIPSPSYNGTNGHYSSGGPSKDYFSANPRHSHRSHLLATLHLVSPRSTASSNTPHSSLYSKDEIDPIYGWKDQTSLSRTDSARPPLPLKIPSQPTQITHMPKPSIPAEALYMSYPDPSGSNGAGPSIY